MGQPLWFRMEGGQEFISAHKLGRGRIVILTNPTNGAKPTRPEVKNTRSRIEVQGEPMLRSTTRIITTHTGSLPRPAKVVELLMADKKGDADRAALNLAVREAVNDVI